MHSWNYLSMLLDMTLYGEIRYVRTLLSANSEQPPLAPHWSKQNGNHLWDTYEKDMEGRLDWSYINYIFGFANEEACINRLLGRS
jgi:hypothetical protein